MHFYEADSEVFRGQGDPDADDEEYEEYLRRQRQERKKAQQSTSNTPKPSPSGSGATSSRPVQMVLEAEHEQRVAARETLDEREHRWDALTEEALGGGGTTGLSEPLTAEEASKQIAASQRALREDAVEFVQSYR